MLRYRPRARRGVDGQIIGSGVNGLSTSQDGRLGAFHEQLTLGGGDRVWAHAPTMVDTRSSTPLSPS